MNHLARIAPSSPASVSRNRVGYTIMESLIAMTLLAAGTTMLAGMSMHRRTADRINLHQEIVNDELIRLGDQLRMGSLAGATWSQSIERLSVSDYTSQRLVDATLDADVFKDADGRRVLVSLSWTSGGTARRESVVIWEESSARAADSTEDSQP